MTLKEFFDLLAANPAWIIFYFLLIPFTAWLASVLGKNEGHLSPWCYLYSTLIYLVCIPGIFAITLDVYLFLFERRSIFEMDIYTQVLPILSMVVSLLLIQKNVPLDEIPGFGRLSALVMMIMAVMVLMWIVDKTRIFVFTYLPFQYVFLIFAVLFIIFRFGWGRLIETDSNRN